MKQNSPQSSVSQLRIINRVVFILSLIGIAIALYVTQSFIRQSSIVCVNTGCETVRKAAQSYIFGIPVPAFGLIGYSILALLAFTRTASQKKWLLSAMMVIAGGGVGFVSWFTWTEIFVIRAICTWCAISAVNMVVIFSLLVYSYFLHNETHRRK